MENQSIVLTARSSLYHIVTLLVTILYVQHNQNPLSPRLKVFICIKMPHPILFPVFYEFFVVFQNPKPPLNPHPSVSDTRDLLLTASSFDYINFCLNDAGSSGSIGFSFFLFSFYFLFLTPKKGSQIEYSFFFLLCLFSILCD